MDNLYFLKYMDNTSVVDHNRLKEILFPFFVPVFVFRFNVRIGDFRIRQRSEERRVGKEC